MAQKKGKKNSSTHNYAAWGAGLGALAAGAAGAYFLYGTEEGKKRRKHFKSWSLKMRGDVMSKLENLKEVNEDKYHEIIDGVADRYKKMKSVDPQELTALVSDMKRHWKNIKRDLEGGTQKKKSSSKKKASTSRKKATKKSVAKKSSSKKTKK